MNKILERGFGVYKIFLKNKLAASMMMLVSGVLMTISAVNGHGNDTKTLPTLITAAGVLFSLWAFYRLGYLKSDRDRLKDEAEKALLGRTLGLQSLEALLYIAVTAVGIYLLMNETLVNLMLNFITGGFTIFNGIMGTISLVKRRKERNWRWGVRLVLTLVELGFGTYFIVSASSVDTKGLLVMGILTAVAGLTEIITVASVETLKNTVADGKAAVRVIKTGKATEGDDSSR